MAKGNSSRQGESSSNRLDNGASSHGASGRTWAAPFEPLAAFILTGKTGSGKSSLIRLLGGRDLEGNEPEVTDGLDSCTKNPTAYMAVVGGRRIVLIDTPGFDDSGIENLELLNDIAANLHTFALQKHEIQTQGVIFLHDISEKRFGGSQRKTLEILKAICGPEGMRNCIIGTTMWSTPGNPTYQKELARESEFQRNHWQGILKTTRILENDMTAVVGIINDILARPPVLLQIQKEMLRPPHTLEKTTVGKVAIPEGRAEADRLRREFEIYQRQAREEADAQEAEYRRQREEEMARFEAERVRHAEEAREREEEQRRRAEEQRRLYQEEIHQMNEENRKRQEAEANRLLEEEQRKREAEWEERKAYMEKCMEEFLAVEEERRKNFEDERRKREEEAEERAAEERRRNLRIATQHERARTEPPPVAWWEYIMRAIPIIGNLFRR